MPASRIQIQGLVDNPSESLATELKDWIDPSLPAGKEKILKACIAMRNRGDGGFLLVGFDNTTSAPNSADAPRDVRAAFHADKINEMVNRHASERFEVHVHFGVPALGGGQEFPVLEVEAGAETLVAVKRPFKGADGTDLVEKDAVYIRSLSQNNTPSTGKPRAEDWQTILNPLFENREAGVGRFLRRNLDQGQLRALSEMAGALAGDEFAATQGPSPEVQTLTFLRDDYARFQEQQRQRNLTRLPRHGWWEVAVVVEGDLPGGPPTEDFLNLISASNPRYTGWPAWIDSRGLANEEGEADPGPRPYTYDGSWEAFVYRTRRGGPGDRLDFWRAEPAGRFTSTVRCGTTLSRDPQRPSR